MKTISHSEFLKLKAKQAHTAKCKAGQLAKLNTAPATHNGCKGDRTKSMTYDWKASQAYSLSNTGKIKTERSNNGETYSQPMRGAKMQKINTKGKLY